MKKVFLSLSLMFFLFLNIPASVAGEGISEQQAISIAQQAFPGRVLSVKHQGDSYHVKTLNDRGEVRIIVIDADSGNVISGN